MKSKLPNLFFFLTALQGLTALVFYLAIPSEAKTGLPFHQSLPRLLVAAVMLLVVFASFFLFILCLKRGNFRSRLSLWIETKLSIDSELLFAVSSLSLTAFIFSVEAFFLSFVSLPALARPLMLWAAAVFLQTWIFLRILYPERYETISTILRRKWKNWSPVQHKTFLVMVLVMVVYFCAFIPANSTGWTGPAAAFSSGVDEDIQYPIVVDTLTLRETFSSTVYHMIANESDVYGHQYITLEALILLPSRIIFGADFGSQVQLNLFLLRQFICVFFTALSIFLMVYLITKFTNLLVSTGLFVFMLTIPGIVKFNTRFLHPDAVVLYLIVLTFYFLQKDDFRFKRYFFFAAATSSMAIGIKLWGVFFVFPVALYLLLGLTRKKIKLKRAFLLGVGFLMIMVIAVVVTNPSLLIPSVFKLQVGGIVGQISNRTVGYADPTNSGIYTKDFPTWMKAFEEFYLQEYYFFFCYLALGIYAFVGQRRLLAQMLLAWCVPLALFLIYFIAAKSYWWMMELFIPLYPAPFLLLSLTSEKENSTVSGFLQKTKLSTLVWVVVLLACSGQFVINLIKVIG